MEKHQYDWFAPKEIGVPSIFLPCHYGVKSDFRSVLHSEWWEKMLLKAKVVRVRRNKQRRRETVLRRRMNIRSARSV